MIKVPSAPIFICVFIYFILLFSVAVSHAHDCSIRSVDLQKTVHWTLCLQPALQSLCLSSRPLGIVFSLTCQRCWCPLWRHRGLFSFYTLWSIPLQVNLMVFVLCAFWRCSFVLPLPLPRVNLPVIDMMVDPDGTLDSLSNLDVSRSPGTQPGPEISAGSTSSRPEAKAAQPCEAAGKTEVAEPESATQQASRTHKWSTSITSYMKDMS